MLENQRDQLYNQQYNMEQTSFALESMKDSVNQVKAMKAANKELKQAFGQKELNINSIDKLHDDMADMMVRSCHSNQIFWDFLHLSSANSFHLMEAPKICLQAECLKGFVSCKLRGCQCFSQKHSLFSTNPLFSLKTSL